MSLLAGIKVLDLSLQLPGPFCTMLMADYGADVVKVDEPSPRARNPFAAEEPGTGVIERYLNRGKRSLTLNLKTDEGREIFGALAATADVVLEGFRPGVVDRLGVDYATLSRRNPRLVYASISGYGQTGPLRDVAGHDINYVSYAGVLGLCGPSDGPPALPPVQIGDLFGGAMMSLAGILMALLSTQATGKGQYVDVSMTDGACAMLSIHAAGFLAEGTAPERGRMTLSGGIPSYGAYRCADGGYLSLGSLEGWFWDRVLKALGREDLRDAHYAAGEAGESARRELERIFAGKTRDEWVAFFAGVDACVSPVLSLSEALSHPHAAAREMVVEVERPGGGRERQLGLPIKFPGAAIGPPRRAPALGEHDDEILRGIGYDDARIAALRTRGVIRAGK